jgi:hypothetical protein
MTDWTLPPPIDKQGEAISSQIDQLLLQERRHFLRSHVRTLLVSADQDTDNEFRQQIYSALGEQIFVPLLEPDTSAEISTMAYSKENIKKVRKVLAAFEPSLFVWVLDPVSSSATTTTTSQPQSNNETNDPIKRGLKRALSAYLLAVRGFAIEMGSAIILVMNNAEIVAKQIQSEIDSYRNLLPALPNQNEDCTVSNILRAIEAEFAAATRASGSRPYSFSFISVNYNTKTISTTHNNTTILNNHVELKHLVISEMSRVRKLLEESLTDTIPVTTTTTATATTIPQTNQQQLLPLKSSKFIPLLLLITFASFSGIIALFMFKNNNNKSLLKNIMNSKFFSNNKQS